MKKKKITRKIVLTFTDKPPHETVKMKVTGFGPGKPGIIITKLRNARVSVTPHWRLPIGDEFEEVVATNGRLTITIEGDL
jgi:hypothetical protein